MKWYYPALLMLISALLYRAILPVVRYYDSKTEVESVESEPLYVDPSQAGIRVTVYPELVYIDYPDTDSDIIVYAAENRKVYITDNIQGNVFPVILNSKNTSVKAFGLIPQKDRFEMTSFDADYNDHPMPIPDEGISITTVAYE